MAKALTIEKTRDSGRDEWLTLPDPDDPSQDLWLCSIREAARRVLMDADGQWVRYQEVANRALARGYRSNRIVTTYERIVKSFLDIMSQQPDFERSGPLFRISR